MEALLELNASDEWINRDDVADHLSITVDGEDVKEILYRFVHAGLCVDDGGWGSEKHFMLTLKGIEWAQREDLM